MKKLLCFAASLLVVAPFVFGAGGVPSGTPARLKVQALGVNATPANTGTITASANGGGAVVTSTVGNSGTLDNDSARFIVSAGTSQIQVGACGQNQVSLCKNTNGPSAPSAYIQTFNGIPISFGTSNTERVRIDGVSVAGEVLTLKGAGAGSANVAYMAFRDTANARTGYVGDSGAGDGSVNVSSDTGTISLTTNGTHSISLDQSGNAQVDGSNICRANGTGCPTTPKIVWGRITGAGGITDSGGYGGASLSSVTKGTTGKYQLNMTGFSSGPACTCSAYQSSAGYVCGNDAATGSILMWLGGSTATLVDISFQFHCIGG